IPADVAVQPVDEASLAYTPVKRSVSAGDPRDVEAAADALLAARHPVVHAGQGGLYAEASDELVERAELLALPVMTPLLGKSAFPETHPLALGCGTGVMPRALHDLVWRADLIVGVGCGFTRHGMSMPLPAGTPLIHVTNDPAD